MNDTEDFKDIDVLDFLFGCTVIYLVVVFGPLSVVLWIIIGILQWMLRRSAIFRNFLSRYIKSPAVLDFIAPLPLKKEIQEKPDQSPRLLDIPAPTVTKKTDRLTQPNTVQGESPFWKDIISETPVKKDSGDILGRIPNLISYDKIPTPGTKLAVPIGYGIDDEGEARWIWGDFGSSTIHGLIAGQSGTGKDTILKLWFVALTKNNKPSEVKFIVLDGKGEWVINPLINAQHMLYPPVGGINMVASKDKNGKTVWTDRANEDIEEAISAVFEEINRRNKLFQKHSVANIERYREKTKLPLPYIIIFATDVGTNAEGLKNLLNVLVSKGRSLGIRLIISMQTTSKQDTFWRSNLSLTIAGSVQLDSQDGPIMGISVEDMLYRPSKLPHPKKRPGIFVMRAGDEQAVVQVPYIPDEVWELYINNILPQKNPVGDLQKALLEPPNAQGLLP